MQARRQNWRNQVAGFASLDSPRDERAPTPTLPRKRGRGGDSDVAGIEQLYRSSFRGASKTRTRNLEIPGLVLRTIPE